RSTSCGDTPKRRSFAASLASAERNGGSAPDNSTMPSSVVSALVGAATRPPSRIGLSAGSVPALQIRMRMRLKFVAGHHRVNDNGRADQRQRHESQADFGAGKILRRDRADL